MARDATENPAESAHRSATQCPVCRAQSSHDFFAMPAVPVTCASVFATQREAQGVPRGDVQLAVCGRCGFVFNRCFDPVLARIGARYESSQGASAHFGAFARSLAEEWVDRHDLAGRTVVEVGCGSGHFMRQLLCAGVGAVIGVDPLADSDAADGDSRVQIIAEEFSERLVALQADALVCRHTLEHVPQVHAFLSLLRRWASAAPNRVLLFELPDGERVFAERAFWDVYYEHCNYFTGQTLRFAFEAAGFHVSRIERVYGGQYLVLEAIAGSAHDGVDGHANAAAARAGCDEFQVKVRKSIEHCAAALAQLAARARPLALWQGASKTVGFLSALKDTTCIDAAIDLNPQRHGKFLPGSGLPVYAPPELLRLEPRHVVLMNPVYLQEVREHVRSLGLDLYVYPINELLLAGFKPQR